MRKRLKRIMKRRPPGGEAGAIGRGRGQGRIFGATSNSRGRVRKGLNGWGQEACNSVCWGHAALPGDSRIQVKG